VALSAVPFIPKDGTITIEDATGTPISMTVAYEAGDLKMGPFSQSNMNVEAFFDRGVEFAQRLVQEQPIPWSFTAIATEFADATEKTLIDVFCKTGAWSSGVSQLGAAAEVWAVKITWAGDASSIGGDTSVVALTYCVGQVEFSEGTPGQFSCSGLAHFVGSAGLAIA